MMKWLVKYSALLLAFAAGQVAAECLVLQNINVIDMLDDQVKTGRDLWLRNGVIEKIDHHQARPDTGCRLIDGTGKYVLPGLTDTHVHHHRMTMQDPLTLFKLYVANGVTTVRNMAEHGPGQDVIAVRRASNDGRIAPNYFTSGPQLNGQNLPTVEAAIKAVAQHSARGYDFIKVHGDMAPEVYQALLQQATLAKIPVVGHAQRHLPLHYSLRMNALAHIEELVALLAYPKLQLPAVTDSQLDALVKQVKDSGISVSTTLSVIAMIPEYTDDERFAALKRRGLTRYMAYGEYEWFTDSNNPSYQAAFFRTPHMRRYIADLITTSRQLSRRLADAGVPLLAGSDNLGFHIGGFSLHEEFEQLQLAGLTPYQILQSATVNAARHLGRQALAGTIEPGKQAELLLLNANPLDDIRHSRNIAAVMVRGHYLNREQLDTLLEEAAAERRSEWPEALYQQLDAI